MLSVRLSIVKFINIIIKRTTPILALLTIAASILLLVQLPVFAWTHMDEPIYSNHVPKSIVSQLGKTWQPGALATDSAGNIYVATSTPNIQVFDSNHTFVRVFANTGNLSYATGMTIDNSGNVYVTDANENNVKKFSSTGALLMEFGTLGSGDGQFNWPTDVEVAANGDIIVVDGDNNRIQRFTSTGTFISKFGSLGAGDGNVNYPLAIALDSAENIYIADNNNDRVVVFDAAGIFVRNIASTGTLDGQIDSPSDLRIVGSTLYVVDNYNLRIATFGLTGNFLANFGNDTYSIAASGRPWGMTIDSAGRLYTSNESLSYVTVLDASHNLLKHFGSAGEGLGVINMGALYGVSVDSNDSVYVADSIRDRVEKWSSTGYFLKYIGSPGSGNGQLNGPTAVTVATNGDIYVADGLNNRVVVFDQNGNFIRNVGSGPSTTIGLFRYPVSVELDSNGNLYVTDQDNHRIQKFDSSGTVLWAKGKSGGSGVYGSADGEFDGPTQLTIANNSLYVVDRTNGRIQKFDLDGNFIEKFAHSSSSANVNNFPYGIQVDANGYIYVTDEWDGQITKYDPTYTVIKRYSSQGTGSANLYYPASLALDSNNALYVADRNNSRVMKLTFDRQGPTGDIEVSGTPTYVTTTDVSLNLSATDGLTSVIDMILSLNSDFSGADWESYATTKTFSLGGESGLKTIYVKFRDSLSTESIVYSTQVTLDLLPPTVVVSTSSSGTAKIATANATDSLSGVAALYCSTSDSGYTAYPAGSCSITFNSTGVIWYYACDNLGNCSAHQSQSITIVPTLPGVPVVNKKTTYQLITSPLTEIPVQKVEIKLEDGTLLANKTITIDSQEYELNEFGELEIAETHVLDMQLVEYDGIQYRLYKISDESYQLRLVVSVTPTVTKDLIADDFGMDSNDKTDTSESSPYLLWGIIIAIILLVILGLILSRNRQ